MQPQFDSLWVGNCMQLQTSLWQGRHDCMQAQWSARHVDAWCGCCRAVSKAELQTVIDEVQRQEAAGSIDPLPEDDTPTSILEAEPEAGQIVSRKDYPVFGATELILSNGMKVWRVLHYSSLATLLTQLCPCLCLLQMSCHENIQYVTVICKSMRLSCLRCCKHGQNATCYSVTFVVT